MNLGRALTILVSLAMGFAGGLLIALWTDRTSMEHDLATLRVKELEAEVAKAKSEVAERDVLLLAGDAPTTNDAAAYIRSQAVLGLLLTYPQHASRVSEILLNKQDQLGSWWRPVDVYGSIGHEWLAIAIGMRPEELIPKPAAAREHGS